MSAQSVEALNRLASELLTCMRPGSAHIAAQEWQPDSFSAGTITAENIDGLLRIRSIDGRNFKDIRLQLVDTAMAFELDTDGCAHLERLIDSASRVPSIGDKTTRGSLRTHVEDWLVAHSRKGTPEPVAFSDFLSGAVRESVATRQVWVPLFDVELQDELQLGSHTLKPITRSDIEAMGQALMDQARTTGQDPRRISSFISAIAREAVGKAAVVVTTNGDVSLAQQNAVAVAERLASLLRCLQPINRCCETRSYLTPLGQSMPESTTGYTLEDGIVVSQKTGFSSPPHFALRLSRERVARPWLTRVLVSLDTLIGATNPSPYQQRLERALLGYSSSSMARTPGEKLVLAFASLESLFLTNQGEPIQQNLGRRIAWFLECNFDARKSVLATVKDAYGLRSKFMHHASRPDSREFTLINHMLDLAYRAMTSALQLQQELAAIGNLGQWIDDCALGMPEPAWRAFIVDPPDEPEMRRMITMSVRTG